MGSDRDSTTATGDGTVDETDPLTCATCGARIDPAEWHPVRSRVDEDGEFRLDVFCSMACRAEIDAE